VHVEQVGNSRIELRPATAPDDAQRGFGNRGGG